MNDGRGVAGFASVMAESQVLGVLFIGAGAVNFGGAEGPWDHSRRLEELGGVRVVGIADPDLDKAHKVLQKKLSGQHAHMYQNCVVEADYKMAIEKAKPQVAFIGKCAVTGCFAIQLVSFKHVCI